MSKLSQLLSANGIKLSEKYTAYGTDFDKIIDSICSSFEKQVITPFNQDAINNNKPGRRLTLREHVDHIRIILSCLYYKWSHSTHGNHTCVRHYRNKRGYARKHLSYIKTIRIIDWLSNNNFIELSKGYYYKDANKGKMSRIRPKSKLSNQFHKIPRPTFKLDSAIDIINIRDPHKKDGVDSISISEVIDSLYTYSSPVSNLEKQREINRVRVKHIFHLDNKKLFVITPLRRIFNNSTFGEGGRFYGSEEQRLPKTIRKKIHVNYQPSIERDFKNLHIKMLYDLVGAQLTGDSYQIHFNFGVNYDRAFMKTSVMKLLNAKDDESVRKAIQDELNHSYFKGIYSAKDIIRDIKNKHHAISKYFGSGEGIRLQNIDSEIALEVMYHFAQKDIPCLCIHDSFIVDKQYQNELDDVMKAKYNEAMKFKQFRMLTSGKNQTLGDVRWDEFCKLPTNNSFSVGVD